jgi:hypothetical protein
MSKAIVKGFSGPEWLMKALHEAARQRDMNDSEWIRRAVVDALMTQKVDLTDFVSNADLRKSQEDR